MFNLMDLTELLLLEKSKYPTVFVIHSALSWKVTVRIESLMHKQAWIPASTPDSLSDWWLWTFSRLRTHMHVGGAGWWQGVDLIH
jgi:hypothetical protein